MSVLVESRGWLRGEIRRPLRTSQKTASLTFLFTGASLSWSSPAIPKFQSGEADIVITDAQSSWAVAMLAIGALPGCYIGQELSERVGRRRTILCTAPPAVLGALIMLVTKTPEVMYFARLLIGLSTGIAAVVTMVYITEISDKEIRGQLGMLVQVMNNLGSLLIYGIGPFVSYTTLNSIVLVIPVSYLLLCLWVPETPYYYLKSGKNMEARKVFMQLKKADDEKWADEQLGLIRAHVQERMANKSTAKELFTNKKYRKALYIVVGLKLLQYLTGSLAIQAYLEMIFRQSSYISGPLASIVYGFVQLGAGILATFLPGWFGRRLLMFVSCLGVALSLTTVGLYFFLQDHVKVSSGTLLSLRPMPLVGIIGFNVLYAFGIGNLPYVMQAELFPINVKVIASSAATMMACILNVVTTKGYQVVKDWIGHYTVFWIFAAVAYCGLFFIYFCIPETKDKTLEEVVDNLDGGVIELEPLKINNK